MHGRVVCEAPLQSRSNLRSITAQSALTIEKIYKLPQTRVVLNLTLTFGLASHLSAHLLQKLVAVLTSGHFRSGTLKAFHPIGPSVQ